MSGFDEQVRAISGVRLGRAAYGRGARTCVCGHRSYDHNINGSCMPGCGCKGYKTRPNFRRCKFCEGIMDEHDQMEADREIRPGARIHVSCAIKEMER